MIPWWIAPVCFLAGGVIGVILAAMLSANERDDRP